MSRAPRRVACGTMHYTIFSLSGDLSQAGIHWQGNLGIIHSEKQGKSMRYDLVQRTPGATVTIWRYRRWHPRPLGRPGGPGR